MGVVGIGVGGGIGIIVCVCVYVCMCVQRLSICSSVDYVTCIYMCLSGFIVLAFVVVVSCSYCHFIFLDREMLFFQNDTKASKEMRDGWLYCFKTL